jgi:hypothetical protein
VAVQVICSKACFSVPQLRTWHNAQRAFTFFAEVLGLLNFVLGKADYATPYISFSVPVH